ncbi:hypothetical protein PHISCL_10391, partial [Aspergillus sclerotialis]
TSRPRRSRPRPASGPSGAPASYCSPSRCITPWATSGPARSWRSWPSRAARSRTSSTLRRSHPEAQPVRVPRRERGFSRENEDGGGSVNQRLSRSGGDSGSSSSSNVGENSNVGTNSRREKYTRTRGYSAPDENLLPLQ